MNCRRVKGRLPAYVEGSLEIRIARRVAGHLVDCPACRREEKMLALLMGAIGDLPTVHARPSFASDVLRSVRLQEEVVVVIIIHQWNLRMTNQLTHLRILIHQMIHQKRKLSEAGNKQKKLKQWGI